MSGPATRLRRAPAAQRRVGGAGAREPERETTEPGATEPSAERDSWEELAACALALTGAARGVALRLDGAALRVVARCGDRRDLLPELGAPFDARSTGGALVEAAIRARAVCLSDSGADSGADGAAGARAASVPVVHDGVVLAAVYVEGDAELQPGSALRLESLAAFAAATLGAAIEREALAESNTQLRAICDQARAVIFVKDLDGRFSYVNRAFREAFSAGRSDAVGRTAHELFPPEQADPIRAWDRLVEEEGRALEFQETVSQADGLHDYETTKFPLWDRHGRVRAIGGIAEDVTASKRSEEAVRRSVSLLEATLESTADGLLVVDLEGTISRMNRRFAELWRLPPKVLEGRVDAAAISFVLDQLCDPDRFLAKVRELYEARDTSSFDTLWFKDGRVFERYSQPQRLGDEVVGRVWSFRDVTAQVRAEAERDRLLTEEQQARREAEAAVQARDEFLSVASHELRTPMTSLLLALDAIQRGLTKHDPADAQRVVSIALRQVRRLGALVDLLLDVSRISSGQLDLAPVEVDLSALISELARTLADDLGRDGTTLSVHAPHPVVGSWDPVRLQQALMNLLTNALKFGEDRPIDVRVWSDGATAFVSVRDQGRGVPVEIRSTLFEPFQRGVSAQSYGGLGLGLFVTRAIVEAHGGRVHLVSAPGAGAEFVLELPLSPPRSSPADAEPKA